MDVRGDVIIVGSGIAGLRAAVELAPAGEIVIITKADPSESNTEYAPGGTVAAAIARKTLPNCTPATHDRRRRRSGRARRSRPVQEGRGTYARADVGGGVSIAARMAKRILHPKGAHNVRRDCTRPMPTRREIGRCCGRISAFADSRLTNT